MQGLELSERYYYEVGRPMLLEKFPGLMPRLTAGLVGEGSECFGYDDEISRDHDFGPGFCLWLEEEDYRTYGAALQEAYDSLPGTFLGVPARRPEKRAGQRIGVFSTAQFYAAFIGTEQPPASQERWLMLREDRLATAVNGKIFEGCGGSFERIRSELMRYYPEPVRLRRLIETLHALSQSGQYNYARCMRRRDAVAAELNKAAFLRGTIQAAYLLNRTYAPYEKWAFRGMRELERLKELIPLLEQLSSLGPQDGAWVWPEDVYVNTEDEKVVCMERIAELLMEELRRQNLTDRQDSFLEAHLDCIAAGL